MASEAPATETVSSEITAPVPNTKKRPVVAVFCGAHSGTSPAHLEAARSLAHVLHAHNACLVYGGGTTGLMGEIAKTFVALSGPESCHGILPAPLLGFERQARGEEDERVFGPTTVVDTMHARKAMMVKEVVEGGPGSGFVALSGGFGTLDELFEVTTWNQLGIHGVGVVVFNVAGYFDGVMRFVADAVAAGFVSEANQGILVQARDAEEVMRRLMGYQLSEGRLRLEWSQK
ncbi:MAG: hypothetical protein Q9200_003146 [Gallowayella weberi]